MPFTKSSGKTWWEKGGTRRVCEGCGKDVEVLSQTLPVCTHCLRKGGETIQSRVETAHLLARMPFHLVHHPPRDKRGVPCQICVHRCRIPEGGWSYCGLRTQRDGELQGASAKEGFVSWYHDGLPTNCVADWVCPGGVGAGYPKFAHTSGPEYGFNNLAVFYHGCSFDCLFCQNWTHREGAGKGKGVHPDSLLEAVDDRTSCICYFGGDPTPQLPHALEVSKRALEKAKGSILRICWETNGSMNPDLLKEMAVLSVVSGGCIKFDIKAWNESLHQALCGVSNRATKENFERIAGEIQKRPEPPLLIASTLLVPGYIDEEEVRSIARWIASFDTDIPYALLAFHPQFFFNDLPVTSRGLAFRCREVAEEEGLRRVRIGNLHLLGSAFRS